MKQVLFVMTHPDSGWPNLTDFLSQHSSIQYFPIKQSYHHPEDLDVLTSQIHKKDNSSAIWATVILHSKDFTCRALAKCCKFIYWEKDPTEYQLAFLKVWHKRTGGLWNPSLSERDVIFASIFG